TMKTIWIWVSTFCIICWRIITGSSEIYKYHGNIHADLGENTFAPTIGVCAIYFLMQRNQSTNTCFHYNSLNECYFLDPPGGLMRAAENAGYDLYCTPDINIATYLYLGCYKDSGDRDLPHHVGTTDLTPEVCIDTCRNLNQGYLYAGVQSTTQCFCGTSYGKHGTSTGCNRQCPGDSRQICGGTWANNIYAI
ncbi:unnamed protein product, partial [Owenia fusiformis]